MLYVTTRNNRDAYTAQRALRENRGPDGGLYIPFHAPTFSQEAINSLAEKSFSQNVADILNLLFQTELSSWDVDFCIGRYPVRLEQLRHRITIAEAWHNPQWNFDWVVQSLSTHLSGTSDAPSDWIKIAVRIAVLFGIYGEMRRAGIDIMDVAMVSGDFSAPISAWYARKWGLPIANIICCCNENNQLWDLICHGQIRTDAISVSTIVPEADVTLPVDLERLVHGCGNTEEVERFVSTCRRGGMYCPEEGVLAGLRDGMYVSVVSSQRLMTTMPSAYKTHQYLMSPHTALAYAGLLDYRAKSGATRNAIVFSEKSPSCNETLVADSFGISVEKLRKEIL